VNFDLNPFKGWCAVSQGEFWNIAGVSRNAFITLQADSVRLAFGGLQNGQRCDTDYTRLSKIPVGDHHRSGSRPTVPDDHLGTSARHARRNAEDYGISRRQGLDALKNIGAVTFLTIGVFAYQCPNAQSAMGDGRIELADPV
jgi:hypothetical protein